MFSAAAEQDVVNHKAIQFVWDAKLEMWCGRTYCDDIYVIDAVYWKWDGVTCLECLKLKNVAGGAPERWNHIMAREEGYLLSRPAEDRARLH